MGKEVQELLDAFQELRRKADVNAVFGQPVTQEGHTVIPVAEVAYTFEMDIAESDADELGTSGGGSGGVSVQPLGVVEVTPTETRVRAIIDEQRLALAGALLIGWAIFWLARTLVRIFAEKRP